jgi:hypothetical protein
MDAETKGKTHMATLTITYTSDDDSNLYALREIKDVAYGNPALQVTYPEGEHYPKSLTIAGERDALDQVFRLFYTSEDRVLSAAENIEYRKYRKIIENAAQGIKDEIAAGDHADADDDSLTESIDSAGEVIYYSEASMTLRHTNNASAYSDEIGGEATDECVQASWAQVADIREELGDLEALFDKLAPLTDDEHEEAREYVRSEIASRPDEPYSDEDRLDLFNEAAESVRNTPEGQQKVYGALCADGPLLFI